MIPNLNTSKGALLEKVYKSKLSLDQLETFDVHNAERASRLAKLIQSDVWQKDVLPILTKLYDKYLEEVKKKTIDPDALKVFDDFLELMSQSVRIGVGSMERLAARRLSQAEKAEAQNEQSQTR